MILRTDFYSRSALKVARDLLGTFLVHRTPEGVSVGRIVETEAYLPTDPASHAFRGVTKRSAVMFGPPGRAYIYFIYGMYYCFNVVTAKRGIGEAVLVRALEPVTGIDLMQRRRKRERIEELCSGPGKLTIALGLTQDQNGISILKGPLTILSRDAFSSTEHKRIRVVQSPRIGISQGIELPYRFQIEGNHFVSRASS